MVAADSVIPLMVGVYVSPGKADVNEVSDLGCVLRKKKKKKAQQATALQPPVNSPTSDLEGMTMTGTLCSVA
ncbi:hypothetical protein Bca101_020915 [Brassica carinata]